MDNNFKNLEGKKILIVGFSKTALASIDYFLDCKAKVYVSDLSKLKDSLKTDFENYKNKGVEFEFEKHSEDFIKNSEFAILSPSIPPESSVFEKLNKFNIEYMSDIEFVSRLKDNIVLVTGTNGKTTITALLAHILEVVALGNIGLSPIKYLNKNLPYYVVEASSYQLHYSKTIKPKVAVFSNITPDHITWHKTFENYFGDKAKPFLNMDKKDFAILNYDDKRLVELGSKLKTNVCYFSLENKDNCIAYLKDNTIYYNNEKIINIDDLQIVGPHNVQNVMSAIIAAKKLQVSTDKLIEKLKSFKAISHRLEFIRTIEGTDYYNDSKATNPEAAIVAINSFPSKKTVLIAGGRDKMTSLDEFIKEIKEKISKVILIGEAKQRFRKELSEKDYLNIVTANTLEEAIDIASLDKPDVVLLSPACASFDMFENYEKRGDAFRDYVLSKK